MKNIHVLPTDKPSRLFNDGIELYLGELKDRKGHPVTSYNIYITSDEEIKEGDWCIADYVTGFTDLKGNPCNDGSYYLVKANNIVLGNVEHGQQLLFSFDNLTHEIRYCKKIILTTDKDLIKDGVQAIPDEFLEWFVKNPNCEEVEVTKNPFYEEFNYQYYKIIIPKEGPEQTDEKGRLMTYWGGLEEPSMVDKLKDYFNNTTEEQIQKDWDKTCEQTEGIDSPTVAEFLEAQKQFGKQETLEEAIKREYETRKFNSDFPFDPQSFKLGAKWQQERMYSEEEVIELLHKRMRHTLGEDYKEEITLKWFEQFKKK